MLSKSRVKYIQSLYHKKLRDAEGVFVIEGPKVAEEFLLHAPGEIMGLYATEDWLNNNQNLTGRLRSDIIYPVDMTDLEKISSRSTPNQVLAVARQKEKLSVAGGLGGLSLMLDGIQDPGNLGTIIRIADWFGIDSILCSHECADMYNPKVVQSTMGSILRIDIAYTDLPEWCKVNSHRTILAATLNGNSVFDHQSLIEGIILIGNESRGVSQELLPFCTEQITIPRIGQAESLNAAVATGIILSHLLTH
ncbi:MAG: RNA methyltransferase [Chitinophagaceae bacterium]|nr:RNA methyltransferase [Chitinophagaceae bacterium]